MSTSPVTTTTETSDPSQAAGSSPITPVRSIVIAPGRVLPPYLRDHDGNGDSNAVPASQSRWMVLAVLFLVTGAFGLTLLWRGDQFSIAERCFWSVVVTLYTIAIFVGAFWLVRWSASGLAPVSWMMLEPVLTLASSHLRSDVGIPFWQAT